MWYTTRYEGFDNPKSGFTRTPLNSALLGGIFSGLLRLGFLLEFIGLTGLFISYFGYKGTGFFTYDLWLTSEEQRSHLGFRNCLVLFSGLYLLGALCLLLFQAVLSDDASWARGYRAGAKLLGNATFLDVVGATLQFIFYAYMSNHYDKTWWAQFTGGGVEWLVFALARLIHALGALFYASALFLLEVYHDQGTNDWHGVLNAFLFTGTALMELLVLTVMDGATGVVLNWVALVSALLWAMAFEQEVNASGPLLHETELSNEVEAQVEKFARAHPYNIQQPQ